MMILPLADVLQNCLQNLTSRIAGIDNEQMTNRVMGMGAMLGFGLGTIKEQFKSPSKNTNFGESNTNNCLGGFKGFVNRAKSVINPSLNLSSETDYNGNINPIRNVIPKDNSNISIPKSDNKNKSSGTNNKSFANKVIQTGFNAAKSYINVGAKMAEGNFNKSSYYIPSNSKTNRFKEAEFLHQNKINQKAEKSGDENVHKKQN